MDTAVQLEDILGADPFIFLQFRLYLEKKGRVWLLTFWLDAEFYKGIKKHKLKQLFAKQVYGKYVVPPTLRERFTEGVTAEIELKIKGQVIDDDIFAGAQRKIASLLLTSYGRFRKATGKSRLDRKSTGSPPSSPKSRRLSLSPTQSSSPTASEQDELLDYISKKMFNAHTGCTTLSNVHTGSEAVDWVLRNVYFKNDRIKALNFGQMILNHGGTFEPVGSKVKPPYLLKDDPTVYRPTKIYQDKMVQVSNDEFARQLEISSSEEGLESPKVNDTHVQSINNAAQAATPVLNKTGIAIVEIPLQYLASKRKDSISAVGRASSYTHIGVVDSEIDVRRPYEMLEKLVLGSEVPIIRILMSLNFKKRELDALARATVFIFADSGTDIMPVLRPLLAEAVARITEPALFFRSNDFVTSLVVSYAKLSAFEWLQDVLSPIIETLGSNTTFEFLDDGSIHPRCEPRFCAVMDEVFDCITSAVSDCPLYFRSLLAAFRSVVSSRFPTSDLSYITGFFCLRIVCPALVSPDDFGFLIAPMHPERQRLMVAISKVLQSCANALVSDINPTSTSVDKAVNYDSEHVTVEKPSLVSQLARVHRATLACFVDRLTLIPHITYPGPLKLPTAKDVKHRAVHLFYSTILSNREAFLIALRHTDQQLGERMEALLESLAAVPPSSELKRSMSSFTQRRTSSVIENVLKL